jgi:hypothetical protein
MPKTIIDMTSNNDTEVLKVLKTTVQATSKLGTVKNVEDVLAAVKLLQRLRAQLIAVSRKS